MGRSFAELAAADGAHVGLLDLNAAGLDETMASLGGDGRRIAVTVDLSDWPATEAAVDRCARCWAASTRSATSPAGMRPVSSGNRTTRCGSD